MFLSFLDALRAGGIAASPKEHLTLLEALDADVIERSPEQFYYLARAIYVKDESLIDRFDQVFAQVFKGLIGEAVATGESLETSLPEEWLKAVAKRFLSPEEMAEVEALGSWDEIMATLKQRLAEQDGRHQGGSKWIGTGGTSPFGNGGYNPEGIRIGGESTHRRAIKVWEKREFANLDATRELGTRTMKLALRRLRRFAREGAADELDLDATVAGTAAKGYLDVAMRPERRNAVKLLLFLDIGGSMDDHVRLCEDLFSALTSEFKRLEFFYFHNCVYEGVWKDNARRHAQRIPTWDVLHRFGRDHKLLLVGDAQMSPYEISHPGGSAEHMNPEAGAVWLKRLVATYPSAAWLNPVPAEHWPFSQSTAMIRELLGGRMHPMTLEGLDQAARTLARKA